MTLRLTDEETADLRRQAEAENRSMQEVARAAVREYIERRTSRALVDDELTFVTSHYREALDRLGNL